MNMKAAIATTLSLSLFGAAATTSAEVIKYSAKDSYAYSSWYASDDCYYESTDVHVYQSAVRESNTKTESKPLLYVSHWSSNWCTGEYGGLYGYGEADVSGGGKSLTVSGTVEGYDYTSDEYKTVAVNLSFVANGEYSSRGTSNYVSTSGGVRTRYRQSGSAESADVSGSVTVDGVNIITGSPWAEIGSSKNGSLTIVKPSAR